MRTSGLSRTLFSFLFSKCCSGTSSQQTITLKMADQKRSDFYVAFTMMLCGLNFCLISHEARIYRLVPNGFTKYLSLTYLSSDSKIINVSLNLSVQRIMVKLHKSSGRPWSAIFSVIVYRILSIGIVDDI